MADERVTVEIGATVKIPGELAGQLTVIGEECAVRGTRYRYGKWAHDVQAVTSWPAAERLADELNESHRLAGRDPDVEPVRRPIYAGEWEAAG